MQRQNASILTLDVWTALANAAQALETAARAMAGGADREKGTPSSVIKLVDNTCTVGLAVREMLFAKARAGRCDRYLQQLRVSLGSFARGKRNSMPLDTVMVSDVEAWLHRSTWSTRTQKGYLADVRTLFTFCVKRGLCERNPAAAVELPQGESRPIGIHTPEQTRTVLNFALQRGDLNLVRCLAIRYFAGLRSAEVLRLAESEIKERFIEVTAAKAKTRRRRLVMIQPNLAAWLALGGTLPLHTVNQRMADFSRDLKKKHGIDWPHNATRHSFVSYHLAQFQNAGKTALEAGHSEQMLFAHYRELVTPEAAAEYWGIMPNESKG
ncbi:MAG TPA: site-specific integrase [Verrucomicrobiae bacterium]|nr:site-specific integrase [Verrucomicrobiae bacterium]